MAIVINGSGTLSGLAVGGLPDGTVDAGTLASGIDKTSITDGGNSTAITIDSSENIGIGVTPETDWDGAGYKALQIGAGSVIQAGKASGFNYTAVGTNFSGNGNVYLHTDKSVMHKMYDGEHKFQVAPSGSADAAISWTTAMTIQNNGYIAMGTTTAGTQNANQLSFIPSGGYIMANHLNGTASGQMYHSMKYNGNGIGTITQVGTTGVAYNTSSDYRLKENVDYDWDATTRLKQLKPARFNFIADADKTVDGFIAHEAQAVVPEAVTGTKDAMMDEEYEVTPAVMDGETVVTPAVMGTRSVPDMQGIDQSKLVPLLVKTIQELEARITALEA